MKIRFIVLLSTALGFISCQRELHFPSVPPVIPEKKVTAVVITDPTQIDYDSVVFRYLPFKIMEVHYTEDRRDSVIRTYSYNADSSLAQIEDENAIYYTNNDRAKKIKFIYDNSGQLIQTITDFTTVSGISATFHYGVSGNNKTIIVYDTSYSSPSYNLQWVNRTIYNTVSNDNYLLYDSCRSLNKFSGIVKTQASAYNYTGDKDVGFITQNTYFDDELQEQGTTILVTDRSAPVYEALRKKLFANLANWYEPGFICQDDNYRLFTVPGHTYKNIVYSGKSLALAPIAPQVTISYDYANTYSDDLLRQSIITYSLIGQGVGKYVRVLRYYYN